MVVRNEQGGHKDPAKAASSSKRSGKEAVLLGGLLVLIGAMT